MKGHNRDILNYYHLAVRFSAMAKEPYIPLIGIPLKTWLWPLAKLDIKGIVNAKDYIQTLKSFQNFNHSMEHKN